MSKNLEQVLDEHYPQWDNAEYPVLIDRSDGNGIIFHREAWPSEWGIAPTDEELETWMSE